MSEKKLIVGHNCFLDMAHIYYKFIGPLPFSMEEFVLSVNKMLPNIIDTKHLITSNHVIQHLMKQSRKSLSSAFSVLCPQIHSDSQNSASNSFVKVDVQSDEPGSSYWSSGAKHEAGFDAFMTGCVFAQACSHLGVKFEQNSLVMDLPGNDKLKSYLNILYPSWSTGTVIDLTTGTETSASGHIRKYPKREFANIALLWGFSSKIKPKDVEECMRKFFGKDSVISVFFLDKTAAFVQFNRKELVNELMVLKNTLEKEDGLISVLHPFSKLLEGGKHSCRDYESYKEICGSSMSKFLFADQAEATVIRRKSKIASISLETSSPEHQISSKSDSEIRSGHLFSFEEILNPL
ncbi:Poly(A)-specific ribonuclease PARN [Platanthera guangdongensis]|uniref:Poly(A)-specific ribonuclease PARN n=1 Tax=Platanthera guangdongensis TaxID=2320717 RepID=A0ABR2LTC0_9ASPA